MEEQDFDLDKAMVLNFIQLGMEPERAFILAELPQDVIEQLELDEDFQKEIDTTQLLLEKELLDRHRRAVEIAILKGNTKPIEWMLGKINPDRWGDKSDEIIIPGRLVISKDDEATK